MKIIAFIIATVLLISAPLWANNSRYCISRTTMVNVNPCLEEIQRAATGIRAIAQEIDIKTYETPSSGKQIEAVKNTTKPTADYSMPNYLGLTVRR